MIDTFVRGGGGGRDLKRVLSGPSETATSRVSFHVFAMWSLWGAKDDPRVQLWWDFGTKIPMEYGIVLRGS